MSSCLCKTDYRLMQPIPTNAFSIAIERLKTQGPTPISPCSENGDGRLLLCAAAAVAAAGFEMSGGRDGREAFESDLREKPEGGRVQAAFRQLGWPIRTCKLIFHYNDSLPAATRQNGVIEYLTSLAHG